jgi:hypothetical protein
MSQSLILIDSLSSACWEKNGKKRNEKQLKAFFPGPEMDTPCWLCLAAFSWPLGSIKG